jgi:hypothetical protein
MLIKLMPTVAGIPDRLVMLPGGVSHFVELKAEGGRLRPIQRHWHGRAAALGHHVTVLTGPDEIDDWCRRVVESAAPTTR